MKQIRGTIVSRGVFLTFSSLTFTTLFFPAVLILYFICTDLRWRNGVLLVASLIFYSWGEPIWVLAMIGSTAINHVAAMLIDRASSPGLRKTALVVGAAPRSRCCFILSTPLFSSIPSLPSSVSHSAYRCWSCR